MNADRQPSSRRVFLKRAGAAAVAGIYLPGCNVLLWPDVRDVAGAMTGLLNRHELAKEIGRRYLEAEDSLATASVEAVTRTVLVSIDLDMDRLAFLPLGNLSHALSEKVREDFSMENTASIDGWILARTECLLCAIVYLFPDGPAA